MTLMYVLCCNYFNPHQTRVLFLCAFFSRTPCIMQKLPFFSLNECLKQSNCYICIKWTLSKKNMQYFFRSCMFNTVFSCFHRCADFSFFPSSCGIKARAIHTFRWIQIIPYQFATTVYEWSKYYNDYAC